MEQMIFAALSLGFACCSVYSTARSNSVSGFWFAGLSAGSYLIVIMAG